MIDAPLSRYHIVERGRRLVVVDRWEGRSSPPPARAVPRGKAISGKPISGDGNKRGLRRLSYDGRAEWVTSTLYDRKGPRRISLDAASAAMLRRARAGIITAAAIYAVLTFWALWLVLPVFAILASSTGRERLRDATTALVDRVAARSEG